MGEPLSFLTNPSRSQQDEIESAHARGARLIFLGQFEAAFEEYRSLYERMLGWQNTLGPHRLHKGLPLANMGLARYRVGLLEDGVKWTVLAFIEDALSRAEESPEVRDELSRPAAENLRLSGATDEDLVVMADQVRSRVSDNQLFKDPTRLFLVLDLARQIGRWLRRTREEVRLRIFVSSPGELGPERQIVAETCRQLSLTIGAHVEALLWEGGGDLNPECQPFPPEITGFGGQAVIDEHVWRRLGGYHVYVGMLWRRMGTPTGEHRSGTEGEFRFAFERRTASGEPTDILFYEKAVRARDTREPAADDFLTELRALGLLIRFRTPEAFRRAVFSHLVAIVRQRMGTH